MEKSYICPLCLSNLSSNNKCELCGLTFNPEFPFTINLKDFNLIQFIAGDLTGFYATALYNDQLKLYWFSTSEIPKIPENFVKPVLIDKTSNYNYVVWNLPKNNLLNNSQHQFKTIEKLVDLYISLKQTYPKYEVLPFEVTYENSSWKLLSARFNYKYDTPLPNSISSYERIISQNFTEKSSTYELASVFYTLFTKKYPIGINYPISKNNENISSQDKTVLLGLNPIVDQRPDFQEFTSDLKTAFSPENPLIRLMRYAWTTLGLVSLSVLGYGLVYVLIKLK